ncbi:AAEL000789-PA, partial [Aedes aegypti]
FEFSYAHNKKSRLVWNTVDIRRRQRRNCQILVSVRTFVDKLSILSRFPGGFLWWNVWSGAKVSSSKWWITQLAGGAEHIAK